MGQEGARGDGPLVRDVREEPGVQQAIHDACARWSRAENAWEAVTWAICTDPAIGLALNESGSTRLVESTGARSIELPSITIVYDVFPTVIAVLQVMFSEAPYGQIGRS